MGGIISSVLSLFKGKPEVRILVLGLDAAGKTSILHRLSLSQYIQHEPPTVAFNLEKVEVGNLKLQIWDLGGQQQIRPFWRLYFKDTNGIVFVVDSADVNRLDLCCEELNALLQEDELRGVPLVIMANKQDLKEALKAEELSKRLRLTSITDRQWSIYPTSAVTGDGVKESFLYLANTIEQKLQ